eukprot:4903640-Alexandrium_andersonii.AAC.1
MTECPSGLEWISEDRLALISLETPHMERRHQLREAWRRRQWCQRRGCTSRRDAAAAREAEADYQPQVFKT